MNGTNHATIRAIRGPVTLIAIGVLFALNNFTRYGFKVGLNADLDGQAGIQELAGNATLLYYMTEEAQEGKKAYLEKRKPDFKKFPRFP